MRGALDHLFMNMIHLLDIGESISSKRTLVAIQDGEIIKYLQQEFPELDLSLFLEKNKVEGERLAIILSEIGIGYSSIEEHATSNGLLVVLSCIRLAYQRF